MSDSILPEWGDISAQLALLARVAAAMVLGGIIGYEREQGGKPAGLRTHMLVAAAAALFVGLGDLLTAQFATEEAAAAMRTDPIRIVEAIVAGVSFLGAGTIFVSGQEQRVHGLTTAASLLVVAGVGVAVALGAWVAALGVTLLALLTLNLLARYAE